MCVLRHLSDVWLFVIRMDCSLSGSSVHRILQARILEWIAMPSSRGSSWPRDRTCVSCIGRWVLYHWRHLRTQSEVPNRSLQACMGCPRPSSPPSLDPPVCCAQTYWQNGFPSQDPCTCSPPAGNVLPQTFVWFQLKCNLGRTFQPVQIKYLHPPFSALSFPQSFWFTAMFYNYMEF